MTFRSIHNRINDIINVCIFSIVVCSSSFNLYAQNASLYQFLRNDAGARASGLAGAFTAISGDVTATFYNPAAAKTVEGRQLSVTFFKHVLDINSGQFVYTTDASGLGDNTGSLTFATNFVSYGSFERADQNGVKNGTTFGAMDLALSAQYANKLDTNLNYGIGIKLITNRLDNVGSTALAFDAGLHYSIPKARTNIGFSILHAGTQISSINAKTESLPVDVRLGVNHRLKGLPLLLNVSFNRFVDDADTFFDRFRNFAIGGELYLGKALQVRLGYDNQKRSDLAPSVERRTAGLSAGVGILAKDIRIDYALSSLGIAGNLHRFSVSLPL